MRRRTVESWPTHPARSRRHDSGAAPVAAWAGVERLEGRVLLDATPVGDPFLIHPPNPSGGYVAASDDAVAADSAGNFAAVWGEGSLWLRRFDASGTALTDPIAVAPNLTGFGPAIAMNGKAQALVTFGTGDLYARRFNAAGVAQGAAFRVNTFTTGDQRSGRAAVDADGGFVVVWESVGQDGDGSGVYARRYDAAGLPRGPEFRVNTHTAGSQYWPDVATDAAGNFTVAWVGVGPDGERGAWARRYNADGSARDAQEFRVNGPQVAFTVRLASTEQGRLVFTWQEREGTDFPRTVWARVLDAQGSPATEPFEVPADWSHVQAFPYPQVAVAPSGHFVIAWGSALAEAPWDVYARYFRPDGTPLGDDTRLNGAVEGENGVMGLAADADGDFVVAWQNRTPETDFQLYGRVFDADLPAPAATVVGRHVFYNNSRFDGNDAAANAADDAAVAADKRGHPAVLDVLPSFANVTSYAKGINGVMVDVKGLPRDKTLTADDFDFGAAPVPISVTTRRGAGVDGSDRVTLVWRDYNPQDASPLPQAVANGWLRVTVKANANTGLASPDVFSLGNLIGETGDGTGSAGWRVSALDLANVKRSLNTDAPVASATDFDRNGRTNALDLAVVRRALNQDLPPAPAPAAFAGGRPVRSVAEEVGLVR